MIGTRELLAVERRLPVAVKRPLRGGLDRTRSAIAPLQLRAFQHRLRRRFPGLVLDVHPDDEMYHFMRRFWDWPHHVRRMRVPDEAMRTYLQSGVLMVDDVEAALRDAGRDLARVDSFLEFASGYGRFTRFLVTRVPPGNVTVSDISRPAVDHARRTFGVSGFYSTASARDLEHERRYDVVFVASLFSHLAADHWTEWLCRLHDLVEPGGLLIFSTHGPYARDVIFGEPHRPNLEFVSDGFSYLRANETEGRLADDYYGSTFVTERFVHDQVAAHGLGTITAVYPSQLWGSQDLYVLRTGASTQ